MRTATDLHLFIDINYLQENNDKLTEAVLGDIFEALGSSTDEVQLILNWWVNFSKQSPESENIDFVVDESYTKKNVTISVRKSSIIIYILAPEPLASWNESVNLAFLNLTIPKVRLLVNSGLVMLMVRGKEIYGTTDWVYTYIEERSGFYGSDSLGDLYLKCKADDVRKNNENQISFLYDSFLARRIFLLRV